MLNRILGFIFCGLLAFLPLGAHEGGTAQAAATLIEKLEAQVVEIACLIELDGRNMAEYPVFSLIAIDVDE